MFDIPINLPEPVTPSLQLVDYCVYKSAREFDVHPLVIKAIITAEGGKLGSVIKNKNKTYDLGIMQINTIHMPSIMVNFPGMEWSDVAYSACDNIKIGTWILSKKIKEADNFWTGVANYHSKTPKHHFKYLRRIDNIYRALLQEYNSTIK